ncbi:hypothetical protein HK102_010879, partial [Quaeritorhiza haematococci]
PARQAVNDDLTYYTDDGVARVLNLQPSDPAKVERLVSVGVGDVIPASEIADFELWPEQVGDKNQGSAGACNGHAAATAAEFSRAMQGLAYVPLSAWWIYGCLVKGWDVGSNILAALELCKTAGVAPEADVRYGDFSGNYTQQAQANAKRFRVEIGASIGQDWDALLSEVARLKGINASVCANVGWTTGDGNLSAEGVPPVGRELVVEAMGPGRPLLADGRPCDAAELVRGVQRQGRRTRPARRLPHDRLTERTPMPAYPFPEEFPLDQIRQLKAALSGKGKFLNPAWVVAGYFGGLAEPNDAAPTYGAAPEPVPLLTDDELMAYLDRFDSDGGHAVMGVGSTIARAVARKLLRMILESI